jgi:hypothetical protein
MKCILASAVVLGFVASVAKGCTPPAHIRGGGEGKAVLDSHGSAQFAAWVNVGDQCSYCDSANLLRLPKVERAASDHTAER